MTAKNCRPWSFVPFNMKHLPVNRERTRHQITHISLEIPMERWLQPLIPQPIMTLANGKYHILNGQFYAGRYRYETLSLTPKGVYCPPEGSSPDESPESFEWIIQRLRNGKYQLRVRGDPTASVAGRLQALPAGLSSPPPEEWILTLRSPGKYTIETSDRARGWVQALVRDPDKRIEVRRLDVYDGIFPPNELWEFVSIADG